MGRWAVVTMGRLSVDHIAAVEGLQGPVTIERRCADLPELIAVCRAGRADAALIIGETQQLTATVLGELQAGGRQVVVLSHIVEERSRLQRLGARTFSDEVSPSALARALQGREPIHETGTGLPEATWGSTYGFPAAAAERTRGADQLTNGASEPAGAPAPAAFTAEDSSATPEATATPDVPPEPGGAAR
ncbi:hypothetical protein BG28_06520, partial [Nesterenkonia sp. AN1]